MSTKMRSVWHMHIIALIVSPFQLPITKDHNKHSNSKARNITTKQYKKTSSTQNKPTQIQIHIHTYSTKTHRNKQTTSKSVTNAKKTTHTKPPNHHQISNNQPKYQQSIQFNKKTTTQREKNNIDVFCCLYQCLYH